MDIPKTLFATLVKQGRMEMHLTQEALAEKLGISAAYLGDLERHKGGPSLELFCKTMQTLNILLMTTFIQIKIKIILHMIRFFGS